MWLSCHSGRLLLPSCQYTTKSFINIFDLNEVLLPLITALARAVTPDGPIRKNSLLLKSVKEASESFGTILKRFFVQFYFKKSSYDVIMTSWWRHDDVIIREKILRDFSKNSLFLSW